MIEYYDFTKGGMQQIPGFETLGSKLLGQANPFWKSTENRAAKETTKQPQVKKTPVRTSRVSSMLRDDFLKGFNRDKDEKSFMFVEEPEREEDAFLSGFNQFLNEEKKEQAERKKRQEKLTQIRANADKSIWEDTPKNEDDAFLQGFNEVEDKPESAKKAPSKKDKILDGISTALTAASFIPGVDTVTNLLSIPVDLLRGDYISAGLDLVGAIPFVGEVADVARTARTADRIIDGARLADKAADTVEVADGVADSIKAVDKATDALKTADTAVDAAKGAKIQKISPSSGFIQTHRLTKSKKQFSELMDDIKRNGIREPIKYVEHNGKKYIVDGHHRLRAARNLNLERVPVEKVNLPYKSYHTIDDLFWVE